MPSSKSYSVNSIRKDPYVPGQTTRDPIGLARLLEVYDDYPRVLHSLEAMTTRVEVAEEEARASAERQEELTTELAAERKGREADRKRAKEDAELARQTAKAEKASAETAREALIRKELQPRIDDLQRRFDAMKEDRDRLRKDLEEKRVQYTAWVAEMDRLHERRQDAEERERKAEEDRRQLASEMRELDQAITEGLRAAASKPIPGEKRANPTDQTSQRNALAGEAAKGAAPSVRGSTVRGESYRTASIAPTTRSTVAGVAGVGAGGDSSHSHSAWGRSPVKEKESEAADEQSVRASVDAREPHSVNGV